MIPGPQAPGPSALWSLLALGVACLLFSTAAHADPLADLSRRLTARGKKVKTLRTTFVQTKRLALFKSEVSSKGRLAFARPGRLRWELLPPDASVMVVRGKRAELRVPGEKPRVMDLSANKTLGVLVEQLMVWLGVRPMADLKRWYHVSLVQKGGRSLLTLRPRSGALKKRLTRVQLSFAADLTLSTIHVVQRDGDSTSIAFGAFQQNSKLDESLFR